MTTRALQAEGSNISAFGELLTGELHAQFQGSFEYTVSNTDLTLNTIANGGTITQASAMGVVGTSTTTASTALLQTKRHARYHAGLGGVSRFTALFTAGVAGTEQFIGLGDETGSTVAFKNGYMVGYDGATFGYHRFVNDVKVTTNLSAWDDPLDGSGTSGITLDTSKLNVFFIQYQYLGAGAIRVFVENSTTGRMVLAHTDKYANSNVTPSTFNPNYHHMMWVSNKSTTSDMVMKSSSYAYFIEGKTGHTELHQQHKSSGLITASNVTSEVPILTIRNKTLYASKANFIDIVLQHYASSIEANSANNLGVIHMIKDAILGGTPSWSDINTSDSVIEIDTSATSLSGGEGLLHAPLAGKNDRILEGIYDLIIILQPGETITLSAESTNSATINSHILWKELF